MEIGFTPLNDWVVVPYINPQKTDAGLYIPEGAKNPLHKGNILEVLAAGPNCTQVKVGDTVMINPAAQGNIIELRGIQYVMVNEFMLLGIVLI